MSFGTTFSFTSPLDPPTADGVSYGYRRDPSNQNSNSRGLPIGIDGLSPQSDAVVTHKEKRRPFPGSPIGEAPQHMLGLFLSPSEKSQAFWESMTLSPNSTSLREPNQNLTDQEEDDFHGFSLPPSAISEHDEFLIGMGGMDDIDEFDAPSIPHRKINQTTPTISGIGNGNPTGRSQGSGENIQTYSSVTRSRNRSLNGSPYGLGGIMNSYSPSLGGGGTSGFQNSLAGSLGSSFGILPSHLDLQSSPLQSRSSGSYLFSPSLDSFGSPTVHDQIQIPARRSNSFNPPTGSGASHQPLPSSPLPSFTPDDVNSNSATLSPTQSSSSGEHPYGEHPSRTLFVRNINSNVEDQELRSLFEAYGPIRNMYTQCKHRGFVMISYYDIRHAKCAMKYLQSKLLRRRKLDIHYSIPKDNPTEKDQNQGTLVVFNLDPSITSDELRDIFGAHGEIKEIRETPNKKHHKFIEFYDVRDAEKAMKHLNKTEIKSKKIKIEPSRPGGRKSFGSTHSPGGSNSPSNSNSLHDSSEGSSDSSVSQMESTNDWISRSGNSQTGTSVLQPPPWRSTSDWNWDDSRQLSQSAPKDFSSRTSMLTNSSNASSSNWHQISSSSTQQIAATRSNSHGVNYPSQTTHSGGHHHHGSGLLFALNQSLNASRVDQFPASPSSSQQQSPLFPHHHHHPHQQQQYSAVSPRGVPQSPSSTTMMNDLQSQQQQQQLDSPAISQDRISGDDHPFAWGKSPVHGNHRVLRSISLPISHPDMSPGVNSAPGTPYRDGVISNPNTTSGGDLSSSGLTSPRNGSHLVGDFDFSDLSNSSGLGLPVGFQSVLLPPIVVPDSPNRSGTALHPLLQSPRGSNSPGPMIGASSVERPPGGFSEGSPSTASKKNSSSTRGGSGKDGNSSGNQEKNPYSLDLEAVHNGSERRTTLMIKNIPNKYTQKMLLATVDDTHQGLYDFFYLPIDFKNKCNVGYAFVNFIEPRSIISFFNKLHNSKWEKFNSEKVCEITFARIQGKDNLISHFQNSSLMSEDKRCRPMIFHSSGPNVGQPAPFPVGTNIRTRPKEEKNRRDTRARFYKEDYRSTQKKSGSQARSRSLSYNN